MNSCDNVEFVYGEEAIGGPSRRHGFARRLGCQSSHDVISPCNLRHQGLGAIDCDRFVIATGLPGKP